MVLRFIMTKRENGGLLILADIPRDGRKLPRVMALVLTLGICGSEARTNEGSQPGGHAR